MANFRFLLITLAFIVLSTSCESRQNASESPADAAYKTSQPSLLFFKNMRSSYYRATEASDSRITTYRLNRWRGLASTDQVLEVAIASDWMNDRAFLVPEWKDEQPNRLTYTDKEGVTQKISLPKPAPPAQTDWILDLASLLEEGGKIMAYYAGGRSTQVLSDAATKGCFQTVVKDYLRLTEQN